MKLSDQMNNRTATTCRVSDLFIYRSVGVVYWNGDEDSYSDTSCYSKGSLAVMVGCEDIGILESSMGYKKIRVSFGN
jgi:hypothetical protein